MSLQISVIIPTFNGAKYIESTIDSIITQTLKPKEIIVVDDGSTDDTAAVVQRFDALVKYIKTENTGICRARNLGVAMSSSPWLAFCDHDDIWLPNKLEVQAGLIDEAPDVEFVFTNFKFVINDKWSSQAKFDSLPKSFWMVNKRILENNCFEIKESLFLKILVNQPVFPSTVLIKRTLFNRIGQFNESFGRNPSEDLEFTLRCVAQGPIGVVLSSVVGRRSHSGNYSNNMLRNKIGEIDVLQHVIRKHKLNTREQYAVKEQIDKRSCEAINLAFSAGEYHTVIKYYNSLPSTHRTWKLHAKVFIASLPSNLREIIRYFTLRLASGRRKLK